MAHPKHWMVKSKQSILGPSLSSLLLAGRALVPFAPTIAFFAFPFVILAVIVLFSFRLLLIVHHWFHLHRYLYCHLWCGWLYFQRWGRGAAFSMVRAGSCWALWKKATVARHFRVWFQRNRHFGLRAQDRVYSDAFPDWWSSTGR